MRRGKAILLGLLLLQASAALTAGAETLSLSDAVRLALENGDAVASAERSLRSQEVAAAQTDAGFQPQWSVGARLGTDSREGGDGPPSQGSSGSGDDAPMSATLTGRGELLPGVSWTVSLRSSSPSSTGQAGVTVALWPPAADSEARRRQAEQKEAVELARRTLMETRGNAALEVIEAYTQVQLAEARLALDAEALANSRRAYERTLERRELGHASELDLLEAEIAYMEAENAHLSRSESLRSLYQRWRTLLGAPGAMHRVEPLDLSAGGDGSPLLAGLPEPPSLEEAIHRALAASTTVASRRRDLLEAEEALGRVRRSRGISATLKGEGARARSGALTWGIFLEAGYDLIDGGASALREEASLLSLESARAALRAAEASVENEIRESVARLEAAARTVELRRAVERLRRREAEVARRQAEEGLITEEALAERERAYRRAVLDRIEAEFQLYLEHLRLLHRTGEPILWERVGNGA